MEGFAKPGTFLCWTTVSDLVLVSSPDRFFPFLFVVAEKRVWWISVGCFVLQTPTFWESLIGVDNYKGLFDEVSITIVACSYVVNKLNAL